MKPGRNDPCPCGSGRKYKKCCEAKAAESRPAADLDRLFAAAQQEYQQGRPERAEQLYGEVLAADPRHTGALHLMGILAAETGRHEQALELIRKAISIDPASGVYHRNLGAVLQMMGRLEEAAAECRQALRLTPGDVHALGNLGGVLRDLGKPEEALPHLERAVTLNPSHAAVHTNLGLALHALGRIEEGLQHVRKAVDLAPQSVNAVQACAGTLFELDRWAEARPYFERWAVLDPKNATPHLSLGDCYAKLGLRREATAHYFKALELKPDSARAANNLGAFLAGEGHRGDALALMSQAMELTPDNAGTWTNLGLVLKSLGQLETALRCHNFALALEPQHVNALWNRSLCLLALGRIAEGWVYYDWGWKTGARNPERPFSQPRWEGSDPAGKTILVWMEQGLGDHIVFSSMLPDLLRAGAHCIVECEPRLVTLFQRSFPGAEVVPTTVQPQPRTQQPDIDFQIPVASLARWLRPDLESFPRQRGHLTPDPARVARWRERIGALGPGLKVGICWRSMLNKGARSRESTELNQWDPILTVPGVHFVNLEYDQCDEELREAERKLGVRIHTWDDMDLKNDQDGLAALISTLDLVLSALTAVVQMAGAVGTPTWVLHLDAPDWWALGTDHCPWYPSVRSFPCGANAPWEPVIETMASELRRVVMEASCSGRTAEALLQ